VGFGCSPDNDSEKSFLDVGPLTDPLCDTDMHMDAAGNPMNAMDKVSDPYYP
jgi:hypothetical protein